MTLSAVSCVPVIRYMYSIRLYKAKKQDQKRKIQPGIFLQNEKAAQRITPQSRNSADHAVICFGQGC